MKRTFQILLILIGINLYSQNSDVDSLINNLATYSDNDTSKVDQIVIIVSKLLHKDHEKALHFINKGYQLCDKLSYEKGKKDLLIRDGDMHLDIGEYKTATERFNEALIYAKKENNEKHIAVILDFLGTICFYQGEYDKTLKYLQQTTEIRKKLNDSSELVTDYTKLGAVYAKQKKFNKALEYYFYADKVEEKEENKVQLYHNIGLTYAALEQYEKSNIYLFKCMRLSKEYGPEDLYAFSLTYIGQNFEKIDNYTEALKYHFNSLEIFTEINEIYGIITANINIGYNYFQLKKYNYSLKYFKKAFDLAKEKDHFEKVVISADFLSRIYAKTSDFKNAYVFYKISKETDDSLQNSSLKKELIELQTKYDTEKKENEIKDLNQQNKIKEEQFKNVRYRMITIIISVALLAFLFITLFLYIRLKSKQRTFSLEQKLMRSQMNPHFMFNSLTAIQSFILRQQPEIASKYLSKFSKLMRNILECSIDEYISLEKECETIEKYIDLHNILNPSNTIDFQLDISPGMDIEAIHIPPMLTQPFIENALKHAKLGKDHKGKITVRYTQNTDKTLKIEIEDNGIGFDKSIQEKKDLKVKHRSLAINITKERLDSLNKWTRNKFKIKIEDLKHQNTQGTRISFNAPYKHQ